MPKLLVLADDMTGAIDSGVQIAALGIPVYVDLNGRGGEHAPRGTEVLVVNLCSRHMPPAQAYRAAYDAVRRALEGGAEAIYKKTDSGLRGNIGAELSAVIDAAGGGTLAFVPAYPQMGRTVRGGRMYVDGQPVSQSVFGRDVFTPVRRDGVAEIIADQSAVRVAKAGEGAPPEGGVWLFDAESDADMESAAAAIAAASGMRLYAGCAGFAAHLPRLMRMEKRPAAAIRPPHRFVLVSGSISEITLSQLERARLDGYESLSLDAAALYSENYLETPDGKRFLADARALIGYAPRVMIDAAGSAERVADSMRLAGALGLSLDAARTRVARNLGALAAALLRTGAEVTLGVFGGDTLQEVLLALNCDGITPLSEIAPGVVYSVCDVGGEKIPLISKSGNFGEEDLIRRIDGFLFEREKERIS